MYDLPRSQILQENLQHYQYRGLGLEIWETMGWVGYDRKVLLETGTGYRIFKILIPFYIAGTRNLRLLSVSGLSGTGFFIPDSVSGRNRIKELTKILARILMDLIALKLKKIRGLLVHLIRS